MRSSFTPAMRWKKCFPVSRTHCNIAAQKRGNVCKRRGLAISTQNKSERRRPTGRIVQHILRPPCAQFIRLQDYIVVKIKCTVFCDGMNCNAFVTNSACRKRADKNGKCLASGKCSVENATAAMPCQMLSGKCHRARDRNDAK